MIKKKKLYSFSLIELLVVIAIIGILSAIAVPTYKKYLLKSKLNAVFPLFEQSKHLFMKYYIKTGTIGSGACTAVSFSVNSNGIDDMSCWRSGSKIIIFPNLDTSVFTFGVTKPRIYMFPQINGSDLNWICGYDARANYKIPLEYLPSSCQNEVYPALF